VPPTEAKIDKLFVAVRTKAHDPVWFISSIMNAPEKELLPPKIGVAVPDAIPIVFTVDPPAVPWVISRFPQ
jgi:hypothetical protein